jgi:hypothetical protein
LPAALQVMRGIETERVRPPLLSTVSSWLDTSRLIDRFNQQRHEETMAKKKSEKSIQFRQGDVFLIKVDAIPDGAKPAKKDARGVVLAEGEATGHHHRIGPKFRTAKLMQHAEGTFLRVTGGAPVDLTHEEHSPVTIPPGDYRVRIQREYTPDAVRQVVD